MTIVLSGPVELLVAQEPGKECQDQSRRMLPFKHRILLRWRQAQVGTQTMPRLAPGTNATISGSRIVVDETQGQGTAASQARQQAATREDRMPKGSRKERVLMEAQGMPVFSATNRAV